MSLCNIPSTISDPSYRYQMPRLVSTKEGSGNGVKTSLLNINEVSAALKVPPTYTTKFFGCEVCAISKYSNNESEGVRATVNGIHTNDDLQTLLDKFIEMFVLCPKCHLPETTMRVGKSKLIGATCAACGFSGDLEGANMHKLQTFILSHPPGEEGEDGGKSKKKGDKAARRAEKVARQQRTAAGDGAEDDEDEGKEKKPKKEKKEKKEKKSKRDDDDDDEDADEDGGKKAKYKKEKKEKKEKKSKKDKKKASDSGSNSEAEQDDGDEAKVINEAVAKFKLADLADHDSLLEELRLTQLSNGWDSSYRMLLLLEAIAADNEGKLTGASVQAHGDLVQKVVKDARLNTNLVCRALENFAERSAAACKGQLPLVVKYLYDEDLVDEADLIAKYAGKEGESFLAQELSPLIAWLQESDDDSSSGSDSDSD